MGLLHGFTSKKFSKCWNHPSDNYIGFRYRERYNVPFADLIRKRQFTFYIFLFIFFIKNLFHKRKLANTSLLFIAP